MIDLTKKNAHEKNVQDVETMILHDLMDRVFELERKVSLLSWFLIVAVLLMPVMIFISDIDWSEFGKTLTYSVEGFFSSPVISYAIGIFVLVTGVKIAKRMF